MTTIYDIADLAKVSPSTVSRVINRRGGVSDQTLHRVERAMREKSFRPHWKAAPAKSAGILVFPHDDWLAGAYSAQMLSAACTTLFAENYAVQLIPYQHSDPLMQDIHRLVTFHQIQGVLVLGFQQTYEAAQRIDCSDIPHVVIEGPPTISARYHVVTADYDAGRRAGAYLWQLGHRQFAILTPLINNVTHERRMDGVLAAIEEAGGDPDAVIHRAFPHMNMGESAAMELMAGAQRPTAVVATNGELAIGFNRGCRRLGLAVGKDVSLLGFEDGHELQNIDPPMSAMRVPTRSMGERAARMLISQMIEEPHETPPPFELTLLARQSTGPAADPTKVS